MKHYLIISLLAFSHFISASNDSIIKSIRAKYVKINASVPQCRRVVKDIWGESLEGAEMDAFYQGQELQLVIVHHFGEMYQTFTEYYYEQGKAFFVYQRSFQYNRPMYWDSITAKANQDTVVFNFYKSRLEENRYYFNNGKLIRWINEFKKEVPPGTEDYKREEKEVLQYEDKIRKRLSEK